MSAKKNIQFIKKDYKSGFHKFSTIGDGSCNIPIEQLVTSNLIDVFSIRVSNVGIGLMNPIVSLDTNRTDAYKLPSGTNTQRPIGVQGYIRYNTDTSQFEGFGAGNTWGSLGGVKSTDQFTYITAELTPGTNDSNIRFYTGTHLQAILNPDGNLGIGTETPNQKLVVAGNAYVTETLFASNLTVFGTSTILNTITSNSEQMVIINNGTGPALKVTQTGDNSVAEFYDQESGIALFIGNHGNLGIGTTEAQVSLVINRSDSVLLPKGTNAERPEGVQGYIRYNTDTNQFEGFGAGNTWGSLGGVKSTDQQTYITAELSPGTNDSNIRFYTGTHLQAILNPDGNLGIGTETPNQKLVVAGNAYVTETLFASNLTVFGTSTILNTITSNSEQMVITNDGTGPALKVTQTGDHSIAEFYDQESGIALFIGNHGNLGIGTNDAPVSLVINRSDSVLLPKGTNAERPEGVQGYIRYNTDTSQFEGFGAGNTWGSLGGVKSTDQQTYITAELTPGTNDSNLRFYTGNDIQMIINPIGNVGIGTLLPRQKLDIEDGNLIISGNVGIGTLLPAYNLHVEGILYVSSNAHIVENVTTNSLDTTTINTSNLSTSNFTVLQNFYYLPDSSYVRTHYQISPVRYTTVITQEGTTTFNFTATGLYKYSPNDAEVYQNGYKLAYYTSNIKDYDLIYVNNEINTSITVTLSEGAQYNDIIDIYLWPSYLSEDGTLQPGYVIQNIDYTYWQRTDNITSNLYYTAGNVGIGTTINQGVLDIVGNMFITGNFYPTACNVYDLGSRDLRFRDIYLSGNSINLGDTIISRNGEEGGKLKITDLEGNLLDITTNNIVIPGSIGIGTTSYVQLLHVEGSSYIAGNVGIGTTQPRQRLDIVDGNIIITGNIGIGTIDPFVSLTFNKTDAILLPKGTNTERPEGVQGYIRYNTDTSQFEGFGAGNTWGSLGGVKSTDQQTYITAELTPGTNDNIIRFYTGGQLQAILNPNGNLGIGTESPFEKLVVAGNAYVTETLFASNLTVFGTSTILNTITSNSEQMVIINNGTGPALKVTQTGDNSVAEFYDQESGIALLIGNHGNLGIGTTQPQVSLVINRSDSVLLPKGTNAERPEGVQGYIRYNTDTSQFEGFGAGNTWGSLGGVKSTDQFTYITAELNAGDNDSNLRFFTGGELQAIITPVGNLGIGTEIPTQKLDVYGNVNISDQLILQNIFATTDKLILYASNQEKLRIDNSNVIVRSNLIIENQLFIYNTSFVKNLNAEYLHNRDCNYYRNVDNINNGVLDIIYGGTGSNYIQENRFVIGNGTNGILSPSELIYITGNVGIGTTLPRAKLDVAGLLAADEFSVQSLVVSNISVLGSYFVQNDSQMFRTTLQLNPVRMVRQTTTASTTTFTGIFDGMFAIYPENTEVHLNGYKQAYYSPSNKDYDVSYNFNTATGKSEFTVVLEEPALYGDIVDITFWPSYLNQAANLQPGYILQNVVATYWSLKSETSNVYYSAGNVGIGGSSPTTALQVFSTDAILLPKGNTTQRPDGTRGYIRYNTDTDQFEGYGANDTWGSLGGVKSTDNNTYITAELTPGANDNTIRFYTSSSQKALITSDGKIGIGTTSPDELLHVEGTMYATQINASNVTVLGSYFIQNENQYIRNLLQLKPLRIVQEVLTNNSNVSGIYEGHYKVLPTTTEVYLNGYKLAYYSPSNRDYDVSYSNYDSVSLFSMTLQQATIPGDIIDVTFWPSYLNEDAVLQPGYVLHKVVYSDWDRAPSDCNIYSYCNIGIGLNEPLYNLHVNSNLAVTNFDITKVNTSYGNILYTAGTNKYIGFNIEWDNVITNTADPSGYEFRISSKTHITGKVVGYIDVDVLIDPRNNDSTRPGLYYELYEYTNEILQIQNLNYSIVRTGTKSIDFRITWDPLVNDGRATSDIEVCFSSAQLGRIRLRKINN